MQKIRLVCYSVCAACIALGVAASIVAIWSNVSPDVLWKTFATLAVIGAASAGVGYLSEIAGIKQ